MLKKIALLPLVLFVSLLFQAGCDNDEYPADIAPEKIEKLANDNPKKFKELVEQKHPGALFVIASEEARTGDYDKAFSMYEDLANQNYAPAQYALTEKYGDGDDYESNKKIIYWLTKAAEQNYCPAQSSLGMMYFYNTSVQDFRQAANWLTKVAERKVDADKDSYSQCDPAEAQSLLGEIYSEGKGVRQDLSIAKEWYGKACDGGNQYACDQYKKLNQKGIK